MTLIFTIKLIDSKGMKIGFIGLGKMGSRMAAKLIEDGHEVVAWNRSKDVLDEFKTENPTSEIASSIEDLISKLDKPRVIWIMVSHQAVDEVLAELKSFVSSGDIVIDGGNSFFKDTDRRFSDFEKSEVHYLGIGTSGGLIAASEGYPMMVGGSLEGYEIIRPILDSLAKPNGGHEYFGNGGAGHFVKMVHNGVEYGMMQALGEGFDVLSKSDFKFDLHKVSNLWTKGTIVSGFLVDRLSEMFEKEKYLESFKGPIAASGEGEWTVNTAKEEGLDVEIIDESLEYRKKSQNDLNIQNSMTARVINALRHAFGGHKISK